MGEGLNVGDVGMLVRNATFNGPPSEPPPVYIDELEFYKATGMRTSAMARVALIRLLKTENVTAKSLSRVWRDEFDFEEGQFTLRLDHWVPALSGGLLIAVAVFMVGGFLLTKTGHPLAAFVSTFFAVLTSGAFGAVLMTMYLPYQIASRIAPMIERVNADLPAILKAWKEGA